MQIDFCDTTVPSNTCVEANYLTDLTMFTLATVQEFDPSDYNTPIKSILQLNV